MGMKSKFKTSVKQKRHFPPSKVGRQTILYWLVATVTLLLVCSQSGAQSTGSGLTANIPAITGPQKRTLSLIAREVIDATLEGRPSREATVEARLMLPQPMVVSIYIDGELRARAWKLTELAPIYLAARDLTYLALSTPKVSKRPILHDELHKARVSVAVLSDFALAKDETEIPPGAGVVIYNGFTEWVGLPGDVSSGSAKDLLTYVCRQAGLRPMAWLLPQTTIYSAQVEGSTESNF